MKTARAERSRFVRFLPLLFALLVALALRILLWGRLPRTGLISDEGEYLSAASWLAHGRGFTWYQSYLWTRAPVYPLFVAAHLRLFGDATTPVYITQTLLSLANVALVYFLAWRVTDDQRPLRLRSGQATTNHRPRLPFSILTSQFSVPTLSALLMALYFPFALYTQVLLSETLFIALLLGAFLALAHWNDGGRWTADNQDHRRSPVVGRWSLVAAGALLGLATLTRSLTLAFLPIAALWAAGAAAGRGRWRMTRRGLLDGAVLLVSAALVILPWTFYNSWRLYGGLVVVDTSGAFNLMLGARTAYDGKREDAPPRNFMLALLNRDLNQRQRLQLLGRQPASDGRMLAPACLLDHNDPRLLMALKQQAEQISQAERQQLMTAEGLCLIGATPAAFAQKSLGELIDLFQINYSGDERFADGFTLGRLPRWYALGLFLLDDTIYVLVLPLAVIGWALMRTLQTVDCRLQIEDRDARQSATLRLRSGQVCNLQSAIGLWWLYNIAVAPLLFAINRFRLPLLPVAFICAAYALVALPHGGWRALRSRYGLVCIAVAALLALIAVAPYAYLEPRRDGQASRWASYLGPYPSSLDATIKAWQARPGYLREQQVMRALGSGDAAAARALLSSSDVATHTLRIAPPLLAGLDGRPDDGLAMLPSLQTIVDTKDVEAAVVHGDLLRRKGDLQSARFMFTQRFVDDANPVEWAWDWLHPPPLPDNRIDLAGNLDLGYVAGCYLGEGDESLKPAANFRWCTDGARLRFPGAGTGAAQTLTLRADGRGWFDGLLPVPPVRVVVGDRLAGDFTPSPDNVSEFTITLPPTARGADVVVTLRTATFVPGADRYLKQQGKAVVGQVQRLGVRLDWAELREARP